MWFIGVEVEQETSAPPPKKILDQPLISYDADHHETLFFNPILDQHSTLSDPNSDLDPDLNDQNYASLTNYCNYETAEDLNGAIGGNKSIFSSLFHLNIVN